MTAARPYFQASRPLEFAHRGGSKLYPENTLLAFRGAMALGIRFIETDVYLSRDKQIVIHHDATLERTCNAAGFVWQRTLAELKQLDAGYHFSPDGKHHPFRGQGVTIPTFAELFELSSEIRVNVELKQDSAELIHGMWEFLKTHDLVDRVLVAASKDAICRRFRQVSGRRVATSAGTRQVKAFWAASRVAMAGFMPVDYDALQVPARHGPLTVVDTRFVKAAHARGLHVHVWTIDEPDEMRRLLALGVDGVMSDRPDVLREVVEGNRQQRLRP